MSATVFSAKVVGTVSIGLWAGYNASLVTTPCGKSGVNALAKQLCLGLLQLRSLACSITRGGPVGGCCSAKARKGAAKADGEPEARSRAASPECAAASPRAESGGFSLRGALDKSVAAARVSVLSGLTLLSNLVAYSAASRSGKHPYLIYLALGAPLVGVLQYYGARELRAQVEDRPGHARSSSDSSELGEEVSDLSASTYEHVSAPGKKSDKHEFDLGHKFSIYSSVVAGLSGFLFALSVVGLAGESAQL